MLTMVMHQNQTIFPERHRSSALWTAVNPMRLSMILTSVLNYFRINHVELNGSLCHSRHRLTINCGTDLELPMQLVREI
ncbi:MAG: hypothetical protein AAFP20_12865 [Cyanobacteria bacterium J06614_10]